ncbi:rhomboid family intramembrane serine protease [Candidatus Peribacteria bacterium]|nr:rhomboid family intramembrane serine protease [Candidatus Peribacteria bacterium]
MLPLRDHERSERFPVITITLIGINVLAFVVEVMSPDLDAFVQAWALVPSVLNPVTFLTSMFLHGGLMHIGSNMWYLWIFGDNVEGRLGHGRFLLFYLAAGIVATAAQLPQLLGTDTPLLGASGAIAGVLGMYLAFFPHHRVDALVPDFFGFWRMMTIPAGVVLGFWFVLQVFSGAGSIGATGGGVAWFAHIGGFVFGWILGKALHTRLRSSKAEGM